MRKMVAGCLIVMDSKDWNRDRECYGYVEDATVRGIAADWRLEVKH